MKNKIMKAGGITLAPEYAGRPEEAHFFFEGNATIRKVLSNGASGIVYISELNKDIESPYVSFDHRVEFQKVNSMQLRCNQTRRASIYKLQMPKLSKPIKLSPLL